MWSQTCNVSWISLSPSYASEEEEAESNYARLKPSWLPHRMGDPAILTSGSLIRTTHTLRHFIPFPCVTHTFSWHIHVYSSRQGLYIWSGFRWASLTVRTVAVQFKKQYQVLCMTNMRQDFSTNFCESKMYSRRVIALFLREHTLTAGVESTTSKHHAQPTGRQGIICLISQLWHLRTECL